MTDGIDLGPVDHGGKTRVIRRPSGRARRVMPKATKRRPTEGAAASPKEGIVGRVRPRPAALDVVDAQGIQGLGDGDLIRHGKVHPLHLRPVAQGGVEEVDVIRGPAGGCRPARVSRPAGAPLAALSWLNRPAVLAAPV